MSCPSDKTAGRGQGLLKMPDKGKNSAERFAANKKYLFLCIGATVILYTLYRTLLHLFPFKTVPVLVGFMVPATALALAYIIYNRGCPRKNLTEDMLPDTMSHAEKTEFIEDGKRRLARSKTLLALVIALFLTFLLDLIAIYVTDWF